MMKPTPDPRIGSTLGHRYLIEELVGVGAMGSVYRGRHVALDRIVAIKCMHPHLTVMAEMVQRFTTEARLGARLNHENIVTIFDFGFAALDSQAQEPPYIVMEFLAGPSLASTLPYTMFGVRQAAAIQQQLLTALYHAHHAGVVHRDISPSNVILEPRPGGEVCKLIDFGVARNPLAEPLTEPGRVIGAPQYMAPEQVRGQPATFASDLYSAGAVFYEMLTGRRPFEADSLDEVLALRANAQALDPALAAPDRAIPEPVAEVCRRATDPEPSRRYSTARVFSRALAVAIQSCQSSAPPSVDARRSIYPDGPGGQAADMPRRPSSASSELADGASFHQLLKLESRAKAAFERNERHRSVDLLLEGVRAASAMYTAGQHEVGASAACKFAYRASDQLVQLGQPEEAKSVLGAVLQLLVRQESARADLLKRLSQLELQEASE